MKTLSLSIVSLCLLCVSAYAQNATLSTEASALFNSVSCKLTPTEQLTVAQLSGLTFNANEKRFYKEDKNTPLEVTVFMLDLTNDGIEEVGIVYHPVGRSAKGDMASMLFVKDKKGAYKLNLDLSGEFYFLNMTDLAFPDVYVRNTDLGLPVYRWNGNNYVKHSFLNPKKLKKYVVLSVIQASNRYVATQVGE